MNGVNPIWYSKLAPQSVPSSPLVASPRKARHRLTARQRILYFLVGFIAIIAVLASLAPHDYHRPVRPSVITRGAVTGGICDNDGGVASAVATNSSGPYVIYAIVCGDGLQTSVAR